MVFFCIFLNAVKVHAWIDSVVRHSNHARATFAEGGSQVCPS